MAYIRWQAVLILGFMPVMAQEGRQQAPAATGARGRDHRMDQLERQVDALAWRMELSDAARIDNVTFTSLPRARPSNPTAMGARNPLIIRAFTFVPLKLDRSRKQPLIVYVHGGVHSSFNTGSAHIVRELVEQGYTVVAPDYRGSTGYGAAFHDAIDYGGRENDDADAARAWALENHEFLDPSRVGIVGWSHGGMIALMNIFERPKNYAVAYAGVPVSDLVMRLGYKSDSYRALFSAPSHIGKTVADNVEEYRKRSPVAHAHKLETPLLIHTNTSDEDVSVLEVQELINALKAAGKKFEYKIYEEAPGGHAFNRLDTKLARESSAEIWKFLAAYLKPVK